MTEGAKVVRAKITFEGAEEFIQKMKEISAATDVAKDSIEDLIAAIKKLSESTK